MASNYGSDKIITEGLVFNFHGADKNDNPGTGNVIDGVGGKVGVNTGADVSSSYAPTFDGSDDRIDFVSGSTHEDFAFGTGDFAIECWIRSSKAFSQGPYFLDMRAHGQQSEAKIVIYVPSGKLNWFVNNTSWEDGSETLVQDTWYHVVATRVSSTRYFYVDGVQTNSEGSHTVNYVASRPRLGARANLSGTQYWKGNIPIVRIYKGKGFTEEDAKHNFNAQRDRFGV